MIDPLTGDTHLHMACKKKVRGWIVNDFVLVSHLPVSSPTAREPCTEYHEARAVPVSCGPRRSCWYLGRIPAPVYSTMLTARKPDYNRRPWCFFFLIVIPPADLRSRSLCLLCDGLPVLDTTHHSNSGRRGGQILSYDNLRERKWPQKQHPRLPSGEAKRQPR